MSHRPSPVTKPSSGRTVRQKSGSGHENQRDTRVIDRESAVKARQFAVKSSQKSASASILAIKLAGETWASAQFVLGNRVGSGKPIPPKLKHDEAKAANRFLTKVKSLRLCLLALAGEES